MTCFGHYEEIMTMEVTPCSNEYIEIATYYGDDIREICISYNEAKTLCNILNEILGDENAK